MKLVENRAYEAKLSKSPWFLAMLGVVILSTCLFSFLVYKSPVAGAQLQ